MRKPHAIRIRGRVAVRPMAVLALALVAAPTVRAQVPTRQFSLFTDHKSHRIDDLITVVIEEQSAASNKATAKTKSSDNTHIHSDKGEGALGIIPSAKSQNDASSTFDGEGVSERNGNMNAVVGARVVGVLSNGNLEIEGSKEVMVNDESQVIKVTGIVRPEDIDANNRVRSSSLANAKITYSGQGTATSAMEKGFLASLFDWLF